MKRCPKCGLRHGDSVITCDCGEDLVKVKTEKQKMAAPAFEYVPKRYSTLKSISTTYRVAAFIIAALAVIGVIYGIAADGAPTVFGMHLSWVSMILGILGYITFMALSEGIMVFIDIEANTRAIAENLTNIPKAAG